MMFRIAVIKKVWLLLVAVGVFFWGAKKGGKQPATFVGDEHPNALLFWDPPGYQDPIGLFLYSLSGGWEYNSEKEVTRPGKR